VQLDKRTDLPLPEEGVNVAELNARESFEIPKGHMDLAQVDRREDYLPFEEESTNVMNKVL